MAIQPQNNGLITENNEQYYAGSQGFRGDAGNTQNQLLLTDFNTDLILGSATSWNPNDVDYALNNFKVYTSTSGISGSWSEWITALEVINNNRTIKLEASPGANAFIVVQLTILTGGKYGNTEAEKAYGQAVEDNYGSYQYIKLNDVINNFAVGYVGQDKLLPNVKRSDIIFFAKRAIAAAKKRSSFEKDLDFMLADELKSMAATNRTAEKALKLKLMRQETERTLSKIAELDDDLDDDEIEEDEGIEGAVTKMIMNKII